MSLLTNPYWEATKVGLAAGAVAALVGGLYWGVHHLESKGAFKQLQKDAPVVAEARGSALSAETQAAIVTAIQQGSQKATQAVSTNQAKEVHYVDRIYQAGPAGLSDDDFRGVLAGMRPGAQPLDGIPSGDQREPAAAPR